MNPVEKNQLSDNYIIALILAIAGGFLDAYTFLCRGGVFANAQTGNIVLLGINLSKGDFYSARLAFAPIIAFVLGVIVTEIIKGIFKKDELKALHWRHEILLIEILILFLVFLIPRGNLDYIVNILISFVCSLQTQTFRKIHGNNFASTMCTGNLRSGTDALCRFIKDKEGRDLRKMAGYYGIILFFIIGAMAGGLISKIFENIAIFFPITCYIVAFIYMVRWDKLSYKGE
ncbi:YoaK family protein [Alterileibacterium massiliense]|uniref:YoaK family protein n=1 Tax=Alterileibacterium massiliense TaxID=1870997 RepID=UPI0008D9E2FD|nr:YoaK family protein [Alterileibacterium massiliense]